MGSAHCPTEVNIQPKFRENPQGVKKIQSGHKIQGSTRDLEL